MHIVSPTASGPLGQLAIETLYWAKVVHDGGGASSVTLASITLPPKPIASPAAQTAPAITALPFLLCQLNRLRICVEHENNSYNKDQNIATSGTPGHRVVYSIFRRRHPSVPQSPDVPPDYMKLEAPVVRMHTIPPQSFFDLP